jgi:hypothetical protein
MILIDVNLLIYAIDSASPHHQAARDWLENTLSGADEVGLTWNVVLAFLRIVTHPAVVRRPLVPEVALDYVESWLQQPCVRTVVPGAKHWLIFRSLIRSTGTAGNLTSDAHLAALALEHDCELYSSDHDFKRFRGIKHTNPLQP